MAQRGRPPEDKLPAFMVRTGFWHSEKLQLFARRMKFTRWQAVSTIVLLWDWVAENRGMSGDLSDADWVLIASACGLGDHESRQRSRRDRAEMSASMLRDALEFSNLLDSDGKIHDWPGNQPLVRKRLEKRLGGNSGENNSRTIPPKGNKGNKEKKEIPPRDIDSPPTSPNLSPSLISSNRQPEAQNLISNLARSKSVNGAVPKERLDPHRAFACRIVDVLVNEAVCQPKDRRRVETLIAMQAARLGEEEVEQWLEKRTFEDKNDPLGYILGSLKKIGTEDELSE